MNTVIIGAQWGDEGKGKIVDYLSPEYDVVVRYSGGANAGHSIVVNNTRFVFHLIPSGALHADKKIILGSGMVIDPEALFLELKMLDDNNIDYADRLFISDRAHLVLPSYKVLDKELESKKKYPIGTTGRGIGIAYSNKALRTGIRICDIHNKEMISDLSEEDKLFIKTWSHIERYSVNLITLMEQFKNNDIMFEGAQGAMLDIDTGTYPYVSSGISCAAGASAQGGIGPLDIDKIIGVFKAYSTRVGNGPFITEIEDKNLENFIRETGKEYGATTGRPRRCGYLDLVALKYACKVNSISELALTHLDVYDTLEKIKVCVEYSNSKKEFPSNIKDLELDRPILKTFSGWKKSISNIKNIDDLPKEALDYMLFIEDYVETPIKIISTGNERKETIKNPDISLIQSFKYFQDFYLTK